MPGKKPYKTFDGGGFYLQVAPAGWRWWRFKYRFDGRENLLSLATYPYTSLKLARSKREDARNLLAQSIDPGAKRQEEKAARENTFDNIAEECLAAGCPGGKNRRLKLVTIVRCKIALRD